MLNNFFILNITSISQSHHSELLSAREWLRNGQRRPTVPPLGYKTFLGTSQVGYKLSHSRIGLPADVGLVSEQT